MAGASNLQTSFLGGEISQSYSGRYDRPDYKTSLAVCLNSFPIETGAWVRRGGLQFVAATRGGAPGKALKFVVYQQAPLTMVFTDGFLRFVATVVGGGGPNGPVLVDTNDAQVVAAISTANPAVVQTTSAHGWSTGNQVRFPNLFASIAPPPPPLLQNRVFAITVVDSTHFSLADAISGTTIDGSTLGTINACVVARILDIATPYFAGSWSTLRPVQAEKQAVLLNGAHPQVLTLLTNGLPAAFPTFSLLPSNFIDGPYLDPVNGSIVTYNALVGNVTLTFSFAAWSSTVSYNIGDYVLEGGLGYKSLVNANLNNAPPNASFWQPVQGGDPVGPNGFTAADIGRHIRLFSEPPPWASGTSYSPQNVVKYNGGYWLYVNAAPSSGTIPGTDETKWTPVTGAAYAVWTWGRILSVSGSGLINPSVAIGSYGNLAAVFDGTLSKNAATSAQASATATTYPQWADNTAYSSGTGVYYGGNLYTASSGFTVWTAPHTGSTGEIVLYNGEYFKARAGSDHALVPPPSDHGTWTDIGIGNPSNAAVWNNNGAAQGVSLDVYAGQDFHSATKQIASASLFPSSDFGFGNNLPTNGVTFNLRASQVLPANAANGTLLGTTGAISNTTSSLSITSNDQSTHWAYVWVEMTATFNPPLPDSGSHSFTMSAYLSQAEFFAPNVNNGSVVTIQLAGPGLLYVAGTVINTWRAGVYSDGAGWPTNGTYRDGRLWLGGVVANRFDVSVANQIFVFSPTGPDGTVADSNAISYTLDAPDVNQILWMRPNGQGVMMGTQPREWLVQPASITSGLAPGNIVADPVTHIGSAFIEPAQTEHTLVWVHRNARKIVEGFPDVFSGKFTAPNLADKARHLTAPLIQEIGYQQELTPTIWARCGDGSLIGASYKRDTLMTSQGPTFIGWHHHAPGSGRLVESIAVGPSQDGALDALTMISNDPATGVRHIELLTDFFEETDTLADAWQLDNAVAPTSTSISNTTPAPYGGLTLNGLWHLNGKTVQVFAGGLDCGAQYTTTSGVTSITYTDFTVSNGSITVPFGDGVSAGPGLGLFTAAFVNSFAGGIPIVVGFTYNSDGQRVRPMEPAEAGSRNGPALGDRRRNHKYAMQIVNTTGLTVGGDFNHLDPVYPETDAAEKVQIGTLFSGIHRDAIDDAYGFDGQICWRVSRPWPAMIAAIAGKLETQDE